jgi:hypothetical protein
MDAVDKLVLVDLDALASILYDQTFSLDDSLKLFNHLAALSNDTNSQVVKMAIVCLGNLCAKSSMKFNALHAKIFRLLSAFILDCPSDLVLKSALKSLELITNENKLIAQDALNSLLDRLAFLAKTDLSDSKNDHLTQLLALGCLKSLTLQCPNLMFSHWSKFLPVHLSNQNPSSLTAMIASHPSERVRLAACDLLLLFFRDSKKYLFIAKSRRPTSSFTTVSQKMEALVSGTLQALLDCLKKTVRPAMMLKLLQILDEMIKNCPLAQLSFNFIPSILNFLLADILAPGKCF